MIGVEDPLPVEVEPGERVAVPSQSRRSARRRTARCRRRRARGARPRPAPCPCPATTVTLRPFSSVSSPRVRRSITCCLRAWLARRSSVGWPASTPNSLAAPTTRSTSAVCSSSFAGMHPTWRQVPPDLRLLDHRDVETGRRAVQRGGVATGAATKHDDIEVFRHSRSFSRPSFFPIGPGLSAISARSAGQQHLDGGRRQDGDRAERRQHDQRPGAHEVILLDPRRGAWPQRRTVDRLLVGVTARRAPQPPARRPARREGARPATAGG